MANIVEAILLLDYYLTALHIDLPDSVKVKKLPQRKVQTISEKRINLILEGDVN